MSNGGSAPTEAPSAASPPIACALGPSVSIGLSDETSVSQGSMGAPGVVSAGGSATAESTAQSSGAFGVVEGAPVWWLSMIVGSDVGTVKATFADGSTDQMAPVDGVVVLAATTSPPPPPAPSRGRTWLGRQRSCSTPPALWWGR